LSPAAVSLAARMPRSLPPPSAADFSSRSGVLLTWTTGLEARGVRKGRRFRSENQPRDWRSGLALSRNRRIPDALVRSQALHFHSQDPGRNAYGWLRHTTSAKRSSWRALQASQRGRAAGREAARSKLCFARAGAMARRWRPSGARQQHSRPALKEISAEGDPPIEVSASPLRPVVAHLFVA